MPVKIGKVGKQKNKSAAKKRISKTGSGKWKMQKAGRNHLLLQKSKRQKKAANKPLMMASGDGRMAARLLPNKL